MRRRVLPIGHADQVRTFSVVVSPVARVGTFMVVPAVVSTSILGPVLAADDFRPALGVISIHGAILPLGRASSAFSRSWLDKRCPTPSIP